MDAPAPPPSDARRPAPPSASGGGGFRLQEVQPCDDTASVYSACKQRIDSMFESDPAPSVNRRPEPEPTTNVNAVQARIEKMFSEVAQQDSSTTGCNEKEIGLHVFSVDYLGSVGLNEKVTSLGGLQNPLKDLYFSYKKKIKFKPTNSNNLSNKSLLTGRLEISPNGLKVQYQGDKGDLEQLNSFPTIAVWSAVKFVLQDNQKSFAFLPLITDPDNLDKHNLFQPLSQSDRKLLASHAHQFDSASSSSTSSSSPLFAVVMRKIGLQKRLECHAFVCQTSEDAIVIAATLYKALMAHMRAKEKVRVKNRNGVTTCTTTSVASSVYEGAADARADAGGAGGAAPVRPPRKKRAPRSAGDTMETLGSSDTRPMASDKEPERPPPPTPGRNAAADLDAILPYEEPPGGGGGGELRRAKSVRRRGGAEEAVSQAGGGGGAENGGDILTKVTIPRSGSFLNAGGLTRYKSKVQRSNGQASGGSPLGFSELFAEFRLQEGLHSIDEILTAIIDPEGMSFNDLKPIYKEFLLKLALTLTKDELYQRSKIIMRKQKKRLLKTQQKQQQTHHQTNNVNSSNNNKVHAYKKFKRLKHVFQKLRDLKEANEKKKKKKQKKKEFESSLNSSSVSTSYSSFKKFKKNRRYSKRKKNPRFSTSEESDFFSLTKTKKNHHNQSNNNKNSSSGYVSCSECSYDSDSCTCVSADKCYCSLRERQQQHHKHKDPVFCGCDTDSCTDSNKCYCTVKKRQKRSIFEQLKERGFVPSPQAVATPPHDRRKLAKKNSNTKSTRSLEYFSIDPYAVNLTNGKNQERYYEELRTKRNVSKTKRSYSVDNLAVDYELFSIANGRINVINSGNSNGCNNGIYGHLIDAKRRSSVRSVNSYKYNQNKKLLQPSIPVKACSEALSVKKSAEIAALFADIKLTQTTDIAHLIPRHVDPELLLNYHNLNARKSLINNNANNANNRVVANSLYASNASALYSATNGLYTIQSQSDDSRSSFEAKKCSRKGADSKKSTSALENSLGYLP